MAFWQVLKGQLNASIKQQSFKDRRGKKIAVSIVWWNIPNLFFFFFSNSCSNEWAVINYSHPFLCLLYTNNSVYQFIGKNDQCHNDFAFIIIIITSRQILRDILNQLENKHVTDMSNQIPFWMPNIRYIG